MKDIEVESEDGKTKTTFKHLILQKCQKTFELVSDLEKHAVDCLSQIESCKDQVNTFLNLL